jgi:hypothetical protein
MRILIAIMALLFTPAVVKAQTPPASGTRVRVTISEPPHTIVGTVAALQGDTLELADLEGKTGVAATRSLPLDSVRAVEVSRGRKGRSGLFALIGLGVGAASAFILCANDECSGEFGPNTSESVVSLALFGAGVGALAGLAVRHEVWEPVSKGSLAVVAAPVRGRGFAVALKVQF